MCGNVQRLWTGCCQPSMEFHKMKGTAPLNRWIRYFTMDSAFDDPQTHAFVRQKYLPMFTKKNEGDQLKAGCPPPLRSVQESKGGQIHHYFWNKYRRNIFCPRNKFIKLISLCGKFSEISIQHALESHSQFPKHRDICIDHWIYVNVAGKKSCRKWKKTTHFLSLDNGAVLFFPFWRHRIRNSIIDCSMV